MSSRASPEKFKAMYVEDEVVGTKQVTWDWLKGQPREQYRTYIYAAFERAQYQYQMRLDKNQGDRDSLKSKVKDLTVALDKDYVTKIQQATKTCDPEIPDLSEGRKKLTKISRNCSKKKLERFFQIDAQSQQFVQYANTTSTVPKKSMPMTETRVEIEKIGQLDDKALDKWSDMESSYRVGIKLKSRKFLPMFYYTDSLHEAKCTKMMIESMLLSRGPVSDAVVNVSSIYTIKRFQQILNRFLLLKIKRMQVQKLCQSVQVIQSNFQVDRKEAIQMWSQEVKAKEEKKVIVPKVPKIYSTLKIGQVRVSDQYILKPYSKMQRGLDRLARLFRDRRRNRNATIHDMLSQKIKQKQFNCKLLQYSVHDGIIENMHKLGDIPYVINDVVGQQIRVEGDNLVLIDKKSKNNGYNMCLDHEYLVPVGEICFMATDYGYKDQQYSTNEQSWTLQLRGRKINQNVEMIGENILSQQLGLERSKQSRLNTKCIMRVGLKQLFIPKALRENLVASLVNEYDSVMFRLRFDVGEFHCYSTIWDFNGTQKDLKEDLMIDLNEVKHMKITLLAIKGRLRPFRQIVNEFVNETEVGSVSLKRRDFEDFVVHNDIVHSLAFNGTFYNPKDTAIATSRDHVVLTTAIIVDSVNGATFTQEMEGSQLLIGKYVLYKKQYVARVLKLNRDKTCTIKVLETQPNATKLGNLTIEKVQLQQDIKLIERYGISILNSDTPPQNYQHGQYEWSLDMNFQSSEAAVVQKIQEAIQNYQAKTILQQRMNTQGFKSKNTTFVCGKLFLSLMNAQNLANTSKTPCDTYVTISVQDTKHSSNAKFIDIANERSFIQCKKNSDEMGNTTIESTIIKNTNNPSWVTPTNPQGEVFDMGMFMKKYPHSILIEVYHSKLKGKDKELLGFAELHTEDLISLENYGQEYYLFLEDSINKSSIIKLRSLFIPSHGTIDRLSLDPKKSIFKNAQQFLFYKVLHRHDAYDLFGYKVQLGKFMPESERDNKETATNANASFIEGGNVLQKRYEQFSPEHKKHMQLKEQNPNRPKFEENVYNFRQLWLYTQFENRNQALSERQRQFWEQYMNDLMSSPLEEGLIDDELKSIRSKLTNTTKMISSKYKKRSRQMKTQSDGISTKDGESVMKSEKKGSKFSVIFVGQWEKDQSWKYVDIWYLIKFGIPHDLRSSLWKDLLRRQINEQYEYVHFKKSLHYRQHYNGNISNYENLKLFANMRDSIMYQQIEEDVKNFKFPEGYQVPLGMQKEDRLEEERMSLVQIFKVFDLWAFEFSKRRQKIILYNKGMLAIVQRVLSLMSEEDAFWTLIGMVKAFNNVFSFDYKDPKDQSQQLHYQSSLSRKVVFKNEMTILNCIIKLHYPQVFDKLKSLGMPIEWYFYKDLTQFFAYNFSSELVLRLWDMIVFNLSTNQIDNRKRALWYILAVPLYMIQINHDLILASQSPQEVKDLLIQRTPSLNYNPNLFIDELLSIIKEVFVKQNTIINKLFKTDKANQLEATRLELEIEASQRYKEELEENKIISKYFESKDVSMDIIKKPQAYSEPNQFELTIKVVGFRNIFLPQLDEEEAFIQVFIQADEKLQTGVISVKVPTDIEIAKQQQLKDKITLKTFIQQSKQVQVKLVQIQNGIHHETLGQGVIELSQCKSTAEEHISLKLFGNKDIHNSYIDLTLQLDPKQQQVRAPLNIKGFYKLETDPYLLTTDEETKKLVKPEVIQNQMQVITTKNESIKDLAQMLRQYSFDETIINQLAKISENVNAQEQRQLFFLLQNIIDAHALPTVVGDLSLQQRLHQETSKILVKLLTHGLKATTYDIIKVLYKVFSHTQQMTIKDFARLITQLYQIQLYPITSNEVMTMLSYELNKGYTNSITKVIQQSIIGGEDQNLFSMFTKGTNEVSTFTVTDAFRQTLQSVIRTTGQFHHIDMSKEPFNNINFWLRNTANNIKKQAQHVSVSLQTNTGDNVVYRFKFNASGLYEPIPPLDSILPLNLGGTHVLNEERFMEVLQQMPMLDDILRFSMFLDSQLKGTDDVYVTSQDKHVVTYSSIGKTYKFNFSHKIDKENDFTVDPSQQMRIAKGNISYLYSKSKVGSDDEIININLSALSSQDTFIQIKYRMKIILDFIAQAENMTDVPNLMSEKFQFKSGRSVHHQLDRLMDATKDTHFELVRIAKNEEDNTVYDSFALYHHGDDSKEWRPCRILLKIPNRGQSDKFKIEFEHEVGNIYIFKREDVLLSLDYKRNQEGYYEEEVKEFLDKLDREEVQIAQIQKEQDQRGFKGVEMQDYEGLKIGGANLDDEKDDEADRINAALDEDFNDFESQ